MESLSRQLKKGVLDVLLLKLLSEKTLYGYELMALLDEAGGGYFSAKEGTLYPVLYRLEDAGYIQSVWENTGTRRGAPRKYYTVTPEGGIHLEKAQKELEGFIGAIRRIMAERKEDSK